MCEQQSLLLLSIFDELVAIVREQVVVIVSLVARRAPAQPEPLAAPRRLAARASLGAHRDTRGALDQLGGRCERSIEPRQDPDQMPAGVRERGPCVQRAVVVADQQITRLE